MAKRFLAQTETVPFFLSSASVFGRNNSSLFPTVYGAGAWLRLHSSRGGVFGLFSSDRISELQIGSERSRLRPAWPRGLPTGVGAIVLHPPTGVATLPRRTSQRPWVAPSLDFGRATTPRRGGGAAASSPRHISNRRRRSSRLCSKRLRRGMRCKARCRGRYLFVKFSPNKKKYCETL